MKIRRHYEPSDRTYYTKTGASVVPVFVLADDELHVVKSGKKDIRKEIDSFRESTDINIILHQLSIGDRTMLQRVKEGEFKTSENAYFDSTIFPKTLEEYRNMVNSSKAAYDSIPKEIRDQFNSIDDFVTASDSRLQSVIDAYNNKVNRSNEYHDIVNDDNNVVNANYEVKEGDK